jgi:hypothetical protein
MRLQPTDRGIRLDIGDQAEIQPRSRLVRDDGLGAWTGIARDDALNIGGGFVAARPDLISP